MHPPLSVFLPFPPVVTLSFKASLYQRFTMTQSSCRESCSSVNWPISTWLKLADGVACNSACQVARGQFYIVRHITCRLEAQCRAAKRNTSSLKLPSLTRSPITVWIQHQPEYRAQGEVEKFSFRPPELQYAERLLWIFYTMTPKIHCLPQL